MHTLADHSEGRDNNLNLMRAVAATAVLVSHAYPITQGSGTAEPLTAMLGYSLGTLSVMVFFVISGFLIARSFIRTSTRTGFVVARFLRLWPGLIVCTVLVALALGPLCTDLTLSSYLSDPATWTFILRDIGLFSIQFQLPGVYEELPYTDVVGSIWTLPYEVLCYVGLFALGVAGLISRPTLLAAVILLGLSVALLSYAIPTDLHPAASKLLRLSLPFFTGVCAYVWRDRIPLTLWAVVPLCALAWLLRSGPPYLYAPVFAVALAYAVFWVAYVPGGPLRRYNRLGDYSYGIYIYAFPLQGFVVWAFGPMSPMTNAVLALPLTLVFAVLSWHLVEQPAMQMRGAVTRWLTLGREADAPEFGSGPTLDRKPGE